MNYTETGRQVMILDIRASKSLAGKQWMTQYLNDNGLKVKDMNASRCHKVFRFGPSRQHVST